MARRYRQSSDHGAIYTWGQRGSETIEMQIHWACKQTQPAGMTVDRGEKRAALNEEADCEQSCPPNRTPRPQARYLMRVSEMERVASVIQQRFPHEINVSEVVLPDDAIL